MKILVVDDERPARAELIHALRELAPEVDCFEAANGKEALRVLADQPIELCFLDIQMPGMDGLSAAAQILALDSPPLIVFATAYDAHAVKAFELAALDYLVKPISNARLAQVLERVRARLSEKAGLAESLDAIRAYLQTEARETTVNKLLAVGEGGSSILVDYGDIAWIEAKDRKVFVNTVGGDAFPVRSTLRELEARLEPFGHMRVHKSYLVNLDFIAEIAPMFSGTGVIRMSDANSSRIPLSRKYSKALNDRLED